MLAIDAADARGKNLAIAAVMSLSKFMGRFVLMLCRVATRTVHLPNVNICFTDWGIGGN
jgi:hypothetical protein